MHFFHQSTTSHLLLLRHQSRDEHTVGTAGGKFGTKAGFCGTNRFITATDGSFLREGDGGQNDPAETKFLQIVTFPFPWTKVRIIYEMCGDAVERFLSPVVFLRGRDRRLG
jgi:hypothetical protein